MPNMPTKTLHPRRPLFRRLSDIVCCLVMAGIANGLFIPDAYASDFIQQTPIAHANTSTWGSGPLTLSLVEAARHERPVRGTDPAVGPTEPVYPRPRAIPVREVVTASVDAHEQTLAVARVRSEKVVAGVNDGASLAPIIH